MNPPVGGAETVFLGDSGIFTGSTADGVGFGIFTGSIRDRLFSAGCELPNILAESVLLPNILDVVGSAAGLVFPNILVGSITGLLAAKILEGSA